MYERFFGLAVPPYRLTPAPRYFFLSRKHRDALGHLTYGIREGAGFVAITGEIGAGKTTLLRKLLREEDDATRYAYVLNPVLSGLELLQEINHELGLPIGESRREMLGHLNAFLLERKREGRSVVLVVDEAQALDGAILEQLRMLSNFETETAKLLQIVLVGQPELREILLRPDLQQLNQRITVRWHLGALDREETAQYVEHRLAVASGGPPREIFTPGALRSVHVASRGIPRLINLICHRALLRAYASDRMTVTPAVVKQAVAELADPLIGSQSRAPRTRLVAAGAGAALAAAIAVAVSVWGLGPLGSLRRKAAPTELARADSPGEARISAAANAPEVAAKSPEEGSPKSAPPGGGASVGGVAGSRANASSAGTNPVEPAPAPAAQPTFGVVPAAAAGGIQVSPVELGDALVDATAPPYLARTAATGGPPDGLEAERLSFLQSVQQTSPGQSAYDATESLLRAWNADPRSASGAGGDALDLTEIARRRGLRYLALQGNLNTLRVLDLPAILEVAPDDGSPARFVTLEQLAEANARVAVGRDAVEMQPLVLTEAWFGKAHLFWQDLDRLGPFLAIGTSGDAVSRLHERLRAVQSYGGKSSAVFAAETEDAVLRFQQRERLVADGKVGPMTMIALYRRTSPERLPHLVEAPAEKGIVTADYGRSTEDRWVGTLEGGGP